MSLAKTVEESLKEAESNLRNALAYASRTERPFVVTSIADLIHKIDTIITTDSLIDTLETFRSSNNENSTDFNF